MTLYLSHLPKNNSQHPKINLRRVTSKEVVSGLLRRRRLADRREYNEHINMMMLLGCLSTMHGIFALGIYSIEYAQ